MVNFSWIQMKFLRMRKFWCLLLGIVSFIAVAHPSILIWPTNLHIGGNEKSIALWVENHGRTTQVLQARVYAWSIENGTDRLVEQSNFMISPPMAKVSPGKKQLFRIVSRMPIPANQQQNYRVILDEVPQKANAKLLDEDMLHQGVQFQFRYSIPLFSYGKGLSNDARKRLQTEELAKNLSWNVIQREGINILRVTNNNSYYVNLSKLSFEKNEAVEGFGGYLLPKSTREWEISTEVGNSLYGSVNGSTLIQISK